MLKLVSLLRLRQNDPEDERTFFADDLGRVPRAAGVFDQRYAFGSVPPSVAIAGGNLVISQCRAEHLPPWNWIRSFTTPTGLCEIGIGARTPHLPI